MKYNFIKWVASLSEAIYAYCILWVCIWCKVRILTLIWCLFVNILQDSSTPPSMRCLYHCDKSPSRIVNRKHLIRFLRDNALNAPIIEDIVPFTAGQKRGKTVCFKIQANIQQDFKKETYCSFHWISQWLKSKC